MVKIKDRLVTQRGFYHKMSDSVWGFQRPDYSFWRIFTPKEKSYKTILTTRPSSNSRCWRISDLKFYVLVNKKWQNLAREPAALRGKIHREIKAAIDASRCE